MGTEKKTPQNKKKACSLSYLTSGKQPPPISAREHIGLAFQVVILIKIAWQRNKITHHVHPKPAGIHVLFQVQMCRSVF